jgi:hypothetical protein
LSANDLQKAKTAKKDEFYTSLQDIELEMKHYRNFFVDKIVLCNCDDPYESNFFKYFSMNFNFLKIKKLIATCYDNSPFAGTQLSLFDNYDEITKDKKTAYWIEINEIPDFNKDGAIDLSDVESLLKSNNNILKVLKGNGDFRSKECIELLKKADVVITNPPFSLFREYISQLVEYNKKFIILGNVNAINYKEFFSLIRGNKVWMGQSIHSGDREFKVPNDYPLTASNSRIDENGYKYIRVKGVRWWTNIDYIERHQDLILYKKYTPKDYPKFDNYDVINVNITTDIPVDYDGIMGVPITFLDKYNPEQFEIVGASQTGCHPEEMLLRRYDEYWGVEQSGRLNGRTGSTLAQNPVMEKDDGKHVYYVNKDGRRVQSTYGRIFIRRIKNEN